MYAEHLKSRNVIWLIMYIEHLMNPGISGTYMRSISPIHLYACKFVFNKIFVVLL